MTQPLTHIGTPPPGRKKRRRTSRLVWAAPIVVLLGLVAVVGGYIIAGGPEPIRELLGMKAAKPSPTMSTETQIECANIKHAYTIWHGGVADIASLDTLPPDLAGFKTKNLSEQGKTFLDAVSGHNDQASKHLAVAVADYNVQIGLVNLGLQLADSFNAEDYRDASDAWAAVEVAYKDFVAQTCPNAN